MTDAKDDQTQDPSGQGRQGQDPIDIAALREKIGFLQTELTEKEREARSHQARADRAENVLSRLANQRASAASAGGTQRPQARRSPPDQGGVPQPANEPDAGDTLLEFANEQAKEAALLREVLKRGLSLGDVEGLEFDSPSEMATKLDLLQQKREIESLRAQLEARGQERAEPPGVGGEQPVRETQVDTGGPTRVEANTQLQKADELRAQAQELRKQGRLQEARWVVLRAAQLDPRKQLLRIPGESRGAES